ncbi:hypothetical protein SAMN05216567_12942 [Variovorax sp. OK605]|nr:hypothetical protein SAMN05216567_12942 [Variovorax sp. OK605]
MRSLARVTPASCCACSSASKCSMKTRTHRDIARAAGYTSDASFGAARMRATNVRVVHQPDALRSRTSEVARRPIRRWPSRRCDACHPNAETRAARSARALSAFRNSTVLLCRRVACTSRIGGREVHRVDKVLAFRRSRPARPRSRTVRGPADARRGSSRATHRRLSRRRGRGRTRRTAASSTRSRRAASDAAQAMRAIAVRAGKCRRATAIRRAPCRPPHACPHPLPPRPRPASRTRAHRS